MNNPTLAEVDRVVRLNDPVLRNLRITQCYYEISRSVAEAIGFSANWCTFATWASKQAGQTIRQEDLVRTFEERLSLSPEIAEILDGIRRSSRRMGTKLQTRAPRNAFLQSADSAAAFARAADAVARGNKKVFEEIGLEFVRFLEIMRNNLHFDPDNAARFCASLRPGEPPDGQQLLREAFTFYYEARFRTGKEKSELMLLANLCVGLHEQIRLQPEIVEALNAAIDIAVVKHRILSRLLPDFAMKASAHLPSGYHVRLDALIARLAGEANRLIRQVITEHLMTLRLPGNEVLRLGRDLKGAFSAELAQIHNRRLREILARVDVTPDSTTGSGAEDWADLTDRIHYIADFFACIRNGSICSARRLRCNKSRC